MTPYISIEKYVVIDIGGMAVSLSSELLPFRIFGGTMAVLNAKSMVWYRR
jgi:hypothetical protein